MKRILSLYLAIGMVAGGSQMQRLQAKPKTAQAKVSALSFAKSRITALSLGNMAIENDIAWESFTFVSPTSTLDVGKLYKQMPNATEKAAFRKGFITSFGRSFQQQGDVRALTNWRVKKADRTRTVVAATGERGDMEITVSTGSGKMKMSSLAVTQKR